MNLLNALSTSEWNDAGRKILNSECDGGREVRLPTRVARALYEMASAADPTKKEIKEDLKRMETELHDLQCALSRLRKSLSGDVRS